MSQTLVKFGDDGWYGEIARDLTFDSVQSAARAAGIFMVRDVQTPVRLAAGFDRRFLSDAFANAVARELASLGIEVWLAQYPLPSPAFAFAVRQIGAAGGIFITGGSYPSNVSGLKLIAPDGGALPRWMLDQIEELIRGKYVPGPIGPTADVIEFDPRDEYLAAIVQVAPVESVKRAGITLAIDPMWGTASELLPRLTDGGGSRSVEIRTAHNPRFPEVTAPIPVASNLQRLRKIVMTGDAEFGVGLSGDGSNFTIVDEHGEFIPRGTVLSLIAYYLLDMRRQRGSVARTIATSASVDAIADAFGVLSYETPVGHTAVCDSLREQLPMLMGDEHGGIILPNHLIERDGILATILVSACVVHTGLRMSEIIEQVEGITGKRFLSRSRMPLTEDQTESLQIQLARQDWPDSVGDLPIRNVYQSDGVKFELDDDAWFLVRYDSIEHALQMVAESRDSEITDSLLRAARQLISV